MSSVDNRVVNMQFNNAQFEQGISQSLNSLGKLEKGLNLKSSTQNLKDLETTANKFSFANLSANVQSIASRFSNLGVVGMTALQNLTNSAINLGKKLTTSITNPIVEGGKRRAKNIEQAKFQIRGLLGEKKYAEDWVKIEEDINYGVKDTAYGFDAAAKAASQFMASGLKVGKELKGSLRAVSGVAAMTNSSYEEISHIFTTVAGMGKLTAEQINQFASRGLNVAAALGKQLNMTERQVRDKISEKGGGIDFKTFATAMDKSYGEFAKKANDTYDGALSNMKAALSRVGEVVATPTYEDLRNVFNALTPVINNVKTAIEPLTNLINNRLQKASKVVVKFLDRFGSFEKDGVKQPKKAAKVLTDIIHNLIDGFKNVLKFVNMVIDPIKKAFREMFPKKTIYDVRKFSVTIKELTGKLVVSGETADKLRRIFKGVFALFSIAKTVVSRLVSLFRDIWGETEKARGGFLEFMATIGDYLVKIDQAVKENKFLSKSLEAIKNIFVAVSDAMHTAGEKIKNGLSSIFDSFRGAKGSISILDRLSNLLEKAAKAISDFAKAVADRLLGDDINKSSEMFNKIINFGFVAALLKFKKELANGGGFLTRFMKPIINLKEKLGGIMTSINKLFDGLSSAIKDFSLKIKSEVLLNVAKGIALLAAALFVLSTIDSESLYTAITIMSLLFTELAVFTKSFSKAFGGKNSALDVPGLMAGANALLFIGTSIIILAGAVKVLSDIPYKALVRGLSAVGALMTGLTGMIKVLSSQNAKRMSKGINGVISVAIAIRILVAAVDQLGKLPWDVLARGVAAVNELLAALAGFVKITSGAKKMMSVSTSMVILSAAMEILTDVAGKFSKMSWEELGKAGAAINVLLGALGGFVTIVSKLGKGGKVFAIATSMVVLGASLEIITDVADKLGRMSWDKLEKAGAAINVLLGALGGFVTLISKFGKGGRFLLAATGIVILAGAMEIMSDVTKKFGNMPWHKMVIAAIAIDNLMGVIVVFNRLVKAGDLLAQSIGLVIFGLALGKLCKSIETLAAIDVFNLAKSILTLSILMELLLDFSKKMKDVKKIAVAVGSIVALANAVKILASIGWMGILVGIGGLAAVFLVLGLGTKILRPLIPTMRQLALSMLGFAGSMAAMGLSMISVGFGLVMIGSGFTAIATAAGAISNVILPFAKSIQQAAPVIVDAIFTVLLNILDQIDRFAPRLFQTIFKLLVNALKTVSKLIPEIGKFIANFIKGVSPILTKQLPTLANLLFDFLSSVLDILIQRVPELVVKVVKLFKVIFGAIFDAVGEINPETFVGAVAAFGVLIGLFVAMAAASKIIKSAMKTGLAMIVVFGLLTAMFLILNTIDATTLLTMALSLSGALVAITACMVVASMIPVAAAAQGIAGLAIVIGGLTAIIAAMGALKQIPGLKWLVDEGAVLLKSIGKAIGGFVGGIVGGFLEGMTDSLPNIADNLSNFMIRLTPFLMGIKMITPESMEAAQALVGVILALTAAKLIDGITSWLTGGTDISKFADDLVALAPAIVKYSETVAGKIAVKDVKASAVALLALSKMAGSLPRSGGLFEGIFGKSMSMESFGKQMKSFGKAIVDYSDAVGNKNLDIKAIKASSSAGAAMAKLANNLPKSKGVAQFFTGEGMTLSKFGKELVDFAPHMVEYSKAVSGKKISVDAIKASANAGMALSKLANALPDYDGVAQFFGGHKIKLSDFGYEMYAFGIYFGKYAESIKDIKVETVTASANAAQSLADLSNSLSETGGLGQLFGGKKDLSAFGQSLVDFGGYFSQYNNKIKDIKISDKVDQITEHMVGLVKLLDSIGESAFTDDKGETFKNGINTIAEANIEDFVNAFKSFYSDGDNAETLKTVGKNILMSIANGMLTNSEELSGKVGDIASNMLKGLNKEINDDTKHKTFKAALDWYKKELDSFEKKTKDTFKSLGSTILENWISGMESKKSDFGSELGKYTTRIDKKGTTWTDLATNIGKNIITGLTNGIKAYPDDPGDALVKIATDMLNRFKKKLKVKSPSREMFGIGRFTISGLVNAIKQYGPLASNAMSNVADSIINTISTPLSNISDYLGSNFDDDPIIKPVLDLTEIQNGSKTISDLLSDSAYTLNGMSINGASIGGNIGITDESKVYNDSNVISEIESLRSDVKTLSESIKSLKIVLDTGATIGALSGGIDDSLGQIAMYKERGI